MGRTDDSTPPLPARIRVAFGFLHHARMISEQMDASIPTRALTPLEKSVELAALRVVQQYLLGEMDFVESPDSDSNRRDGEDGTSASAQRTPTK